MNAQAVILKLAWRGIICLGESDSARFEVCFDSEHGGWHDSWKGVRLNHDCDIRVKQETY